MKTWLMRMMGATTCEQVERFAYGYLEGELETEIAEEFERHLRGCRNCERFVRTYREIARPERLLQKIAMPPAFEYRVAHFLKENS